MFPTSPAPGGGVPTCSIFSRSISHRSLPSVLTFLLALLLLPTFVHADGVSELRGKLRKEKDPLVRVSIVENLAALAAEPNANPRSIAGALAQGLVDKDPRVAVRTVEMFRRGELEEHARPHLIKALSKATVRHKSVVKAIAENAILLEKMLEERGRITTRAQLEELIEKLNQFLEATWACYDTYDTSVRLLDELSESLIAHPDEETSNALRKAIRKVHDYSPVDSVPLMTGLVRLGSRPAVEQVIECLEEYDFKEDQRQARKFFDDSMSLREYYSAQNTGLEREWVDWGKRYHDQLSEVARKLDPSIKIPDHGSRTTDFWQEWWKKNEERLPLTPSEASIVPASSDDDDLDDDDEDDDEDW